MMPEVEKWPSTCCEMNVMILCSSIATCPEWVDLESCRLIRDHSDIGIIMLTVRKAEPDRIEALDAGADDYVTKPFSMPELFARIRANLRRVPLRPARAHQSLSLTRFGGPRQSSCDSSRPGCTPHPQTIRGSQLPHCKPACCNSACEDSPNNLGTRLWQ